MQLTSSNKVLKSGQVRSQNNKKIVTCNLFLKLNAYRSKVKGLKKMQKRKAYQIQKADILEIKEKCFVEEEEE